METTTRHSDGLPGLSGRRPVVVCEGLDLSDAARDCLAADPLPSEFLRTLLIGGHERDALHYLAHALPRRIAVRWACACVRSARSGPLKPAADQALRAALQWAETGDGEARSAAARAAEHEDLRDDGAVRFAALAAAWSGESLAPAGQPVVPPPTGIGAQAVAAAVLIAAAGVGLGSYESRRTFVALGIQASSRGSGRAADHLGLQL